jgi:glycosyltransferase involved in cell wall biosynthesis
VFVYFGRLAVEKNVEAFLDLELPGTKVVIGSEPLARYEELKARYPQVVFVGKYDALSEVPARDFARLLSQCDVCVYPSTTDTFGLVLLEALSCGVPVAAYDVQGPRDIITHGKDGYLSDDLKEAALKCLELSRADCRDKALRYSWDSCTDAFVEHLAPVRR